MRRSPVTVRWLLALGALAVALPALPAAAAPRASASAGSAPAAASVAAGGSVGGAAVSDAALLPLQPLLREIDALVNDAAQARKAHAIAEGDAARESREIEILKGQPEGVGRDLELQGRLARAQERAVVLSQQAAALRALDARIVAARGRLLRACDAALERDGQGAAVPLGATQRILLLRLRAAQAEALSPPALVLRSPSSAGEAEGDDPLRLRERADLLRDTADKVRRELARLGQRGEELQRRQRLRERAAAVDEDLFAEQVSTRRGAAARFKNETSLSDAAGPREAPAPGTPPGSTGGSVTPPAQAVTPVTRSDFDPATLDLLRKGDASTDPELKLRALRRAQAELSRLYDQLGQRAAGLERRADELARQK